MYMCVYMQTSAGITPATQGQIKCAHEKAADIVRPSLREGEHRKYKMDYEGRDLPLRELQQSFTSFEKLVPIVYATPGRDIRISNSGQFARESNGHYRSYFSHSWHAPLLQALSTSHDFSIRIMGVLNGRLSPMRLWRSRLLPFVQPSVGSRNSPPPAIYCEASTSYALSEYT